MRALVPSKRTSPTEGTKRLGADHGWSTGSDPCCRSRVEGYEGPQPSPEDRPRSHMDLDRRHPHRRYRRHRCVDGRLRSPHRSWLLQGGGRLAMMEDPAVAVTTAASGSPRVYSFQSSTTRTRPAGRGPRCRAGSRRAPTRAGPTCAMTSQPRRRCTYQGPAARGCATAPAAAASAAAPAAGPGGQVGPPGGGQRCPSATNTASRAPSPPTTPRCCPRPSGLGGRPRAGLLAATAGPRLLAGDVWDQLIRRRPSQVTSPGWRTPLRQTTL